MWMHPVAFLFLVFIFLISASVRGYSAGQVNQIRELGKLHLKKRNYKSAIQCYSLALSHLENIHTEDKDTLKKDCCLSLADCELKLRNYPGSVARCTEVIMNENEMKADNKKLSTLGKAYYRRGMGLMKLNKLKLAMIDFKKSIEYLPNPLKVQQSIQRLEQLQSDSGESAGTESSDEKVEEELWDVAEEFLVNYPVEDVPDNVAQVIHQEASKYSTQGANKYQIRPFPDATTAVPLMDLSNMFGSSSTGGFPKKTIGNQALFGSDLSALGGGLSGLGGGSPLELMGTLAGIDPRTMKRVMAVVNAFLAASKVAKQSYEVILANKTNILLVLVLFWVIFSVAQ